jgi:ABC-type antimicrobial peptide transport system permease subunit
MTFRLGWRLAVAGGREALLRLTVTALGVAIGVLLLLLALTGQSAAQGRAERTGWQSADGDTAASAPDAALFLSVTDYQDGVEMSRIYVAALGPQPPVPPGLDRLPGPGEVAVSPAMRTLFASTPDDQLDDRYAGRITATIGDAGLAHPDELVAVIGRTPEQLLEVRSMSLVTVRGFGSRPSGYAFYLVIRLILLMGAVLLLVPVVLFIVMATRVGAAQREERLAALRLAGATRVQTASVAAVETGLAAVAGSVLGGVGYEVGRRILAATVTFQGGRFFLDDVVVQPWLLGLVLAGVPLLTMLVSAATLRRAQDGPLATSRRAHRRPLSAWRALPLVAGVGGQLVLVPLRRVLDAEMFDTLTALFSTSALIGLVTVGPWVCLFAGRGIARVSRRVPALLASRRMASDPRATFRVVSGVVIAAFAVTYSASLVQQPGDEPNDDWIGELQPGVVEVFTGGVPEHVVAPLLSAHDDVVVTRLGASGAAGELVTSCREVTAVVALTCGVSADAVMHPRDDIDDLPVYRLLVRTDGTSAAENRVRVQAANLVPNAIIHARNDTRDTDGLYAGDLAQLQRVFWSFVLIVAACSLTVGMLAGLVERRRPFALLRASGLRLGELRQVVFLETAAAMLLTAALGVGLGLAASYVLAVSSDSPWRWPDAGVFAMVGAGVLAALLLTTVALPLLDRATRYDTVRYE